MTTRWDTPEVAGGFDSYDDLPERTLGYPFVFRALRLGDPDVRAVLDFGCGSGKVAERIVTRYGTKVVAVDGSPEMLTIATSRRANPCIDYRLVQDARLPFLANDAIDAAMSCYVFINIASLDVIYTIAREVYRVLGPGGRYAILDTNPDTTGVEFTTFRSGDPDRRYARGEQRRVLLHQPDGGELTLLDYHWPKEVYQQLLADAGFGSIAMHEPILAHPAGADEPSRGGHWMNEKMKPPFLIVVGEK
jgi:ubiquinone/menaquinone biosynthesis C-methylase UbiE